MRYTFMKKLLLGFAMAGLLCIMLTSCGTSRSHCNTKSKTRVEMGWM